MVDGSCRVPISQVFGRRITLLASLLVTLASHVWRAKSTNFQSFFGAAALAGVGTAPSEVRGCNHSRHVVLRLLR